MELRISTADGAVTIVARLDTIPPMKTLMTPVGLLTRAAFLVTLAANSSRAFGQALKPAPSGRGTTTVTLSSETSTATISIDYGQPHARGRVVAGALAADLDTVWRLGANEPTMLKTDVDLTIGTLSVPKGSYTLAAATSKTGAWRLVVKRDSILELGRVQLRSRTLSSPLESLTMWLIPAADGSASGEIRFAWGTREFSAPWKVK